METWKLAIKEQIKQASKQHCIGSNLKELCNILLDGDTEFKLVYSSGRAQYTRVKFVPQKVGKETTKLILVNYGAKLLNFLKL
jgi:hypothetical protein